jgi:hypothetical protein
MMPDEWKRRIGGDVWRNLIADECDSVFGEARFKFEPETLGHPPFAETFQQHGLCCWPVFGENSTWAAASFLVHQAGRLFLAGAPAGITERVEALFRNRHCHLVLLSWDEAHIAGLDNLRESLRQGGEGAASSFTIWTTAWIWSEIVRLYPKETSDFAPLAPEIAQATLLEAVKDSKHDLGIIKGTVIAGERDLDLRLGLGTRLRLYYVPSKTPALAASFRCNHLEIILNPLSFLRDKTQYENLYQNVLAKMRKDECICSPLITAGRG